MHADRTSRITLTCIGVVSLGLGAATLLAGFGVFGAAFRNRRLTANTFSDRVGSHGGWLWPVIAAVVAVVGVLALVWLLRLLFRTDRTGTIAIRRDVETEQRSKGRTSLSSAALTSVLTAEIDRYNGVTDSSVRVIGDPGTPTVVIGLTVGRRVDPVAVIRRIDTEAVAHARSALQTKDLPVVIDLTISDKRSARAY